jgi:hypothetical protein
MNQWWETPVTFWNKPLENLLPSDQRGAWCVPKWNGPYCLACSRVLSFSGQHFSNVYFGNRIPAFLLKLCAWCECAGSMINVLLA